MCASSLGKELAWPCLDLAGYGELGEEHREPGQDWSQEKKRCKAIESCFAKKVDGPDFRI